MKIIEAMKRIKHLNEKAADLRAKVAAHCVNLDFETPVYPDQESQVREWLQSHFDTIQEIARLRLAIQKTNVATNVTIELGGRQVTKTIAEWIYRRKDLAKTDLALWQGIGDRNLKEGMMTSPSGQPMSVKIRRYYDPRERDQKVELYRQEPSIVDSTLEVVNAVTEILE